MNNNKLEFEVYGDYALFSQPELRVGGEKCSYPIPTYEAIKGILHSIFWKPTFIWIVDEVRVMNPIQMVTKGIRTIKFGTGANAKQDEEESDKSNSGLAYYTYLKNCRYKVRAHFVWNENRDDLKGDRNEIKHFKMANRALEKGGRRDIFLGTRECQAYVKPCKVEDGKGDNVKDGKGDEDEECYGKGDGYYDNCNEKTFGLMYHGITYPDEAYSDETKGKLTVRLWDAKMVNGIVKYPKPEECHITRTIREATMKEFVVGENFTEIDSEED